MSITTTAAETSLFVDMLAPDTLLPSLKTAGFPKTQQTMMHRLMYMDSEFSREQDDKLYLQHGQGTSFGLRKRRFQDPGDASSMNGDRTITDSVAETDLDTDMSRPQTRRLTRTSSRSTRSGRFSPLLSPPAESSTKLCVPLDDQPSQQDVYDKAPPPGYKRLKKVREPQKHVWSDAYVDYSPGRFYTPRDPSNLGHQQPLFQQLPVQFLGDGFSGDETKTRKTRKRARTDNSSNSAGSSSRKKRKAEAASPILGSLDIVNLSQEERAIDMAATTSIAFAAARAKSKIKDIKTKMIPLRPVLETPPRHIWEFDDKPAPPIKKKRVTDKIEDVIVIPSSCDDSGRVIVIPEDKAVAPRPALPPLREACK